MDKNEIIASDIKPKQLAGIVFVCFTCVIMIVLLASL